MWPSFASLMIWSMVALRDRRLSDHREHQEEQHGDRDGAHELGLHIFTPPHDAYGSFLLFAGYHSLTCHRSQACDVLAHRQSRRIMPSMEAGLNTARVARRTLDRIRNVVPFAVTLVCAGLFSFLSGGYIFARSAPAGDRLPAAGGGLGLVSAAPLAALSAVSRGSGRLRAVRRLDGPLGAVVVRPRPELGRLRPRRALSRGGRGARPHAGPRPPAAHRRLRLPRGGRCRRCVRVSRQGRPGRGDARAHRTRASTAPSATGTSSPS